MATFSTPFWNALLPVAQPFVAMLQDSLQLDEGVDWQELLNDLDTNRAAMWFVRLNAVAHAAGRRCFARSDWDRLDAWVQEHLDGDWTWAVLGIALRAALR